MKKQNTSTTTSSTAKKKSIDLDFTGTLGSAPGGFGWVSPEQSARGKSARGNNSNNSSTPTKNLKQKQQQQTRGGSSASKNNRPSSSSPSSQKKSNNNNNSKNSNNNSNLVELDGVANRMVDNYSHKIDQIANNYLQDYDIDDLFKSIADDILSERPDDVLLYLHWNLQKRLLERDHDHLHSQNASEGLSPEGAESSSSSPAPPLHVAISASSAAAAAAASGSSPNSSRHQQQQQEKQQQVKRKLDV